MKHATLILALAFASLSAGCDSNPKCDELAEHVTKVLSSEKGETIPQEARDKAKKDIVASCNGGPPSDKVLECALAAKTRAALVECDALAEPADE